ncbi:MAG: hypothetical protein AB8B51_07410 [Sedimentitalea sp.]
MRVFHIFALICCAFWSTPALAAGPEETVRYIYVSLGGPGRAEDKGLALLETPAQRGNFFSRRMVAFYSANETGNCVDFNFAIPGQDFDAAEIIRTLQISSSGNATRQTVTAQFTTFGQPARIEYDFIAEDGFWRIDDIAGPGWRVSQIPCSPKTSPAPSVGLTGYCYQTPSDTLKLELSRNGQGRFSLSSWQSGGHSCGADGPLAPVQGGWMFQDGDCQLRIESMADGALRLNDPDFKCKFRYCGQRASLDGLMFAPNTQLACTQMRRNN